MSAIRDSHHIHEAIRAAYEDEAFILKLAEDVHSVLKPKIEAVVDERCIIAEGLMVSQTERLRSQLEEDLTDGRFMMFEVEGGQQFTLRQIARKAYRSARNSWVSSLHDWG